MTAELLALRRRLKARLRHLADRGQTRRLSALVAHLRSIGMEPCPDCRTWHTPGYCERAERLTDGPATL